MTIGSLASFVNPTSRLPRIKSGPSSIDIFRSLAHLSLLYCPESLNKDELALFAADCSRQYESTQYQDAMDAAKVDDYERRYAMDWLTRLIGSGLYWVDDESSVIAAEALLDLAGRILGGHASLDEAGAILREFRFPLENPVVIPEVDQYDCTSSVLPATIEIVLRDDPLPPSNSDSENRVNNGSGPSQDAAAAVGVQTWGASIIVSDVLLRHPSLFHPGLASASHDRLRIAELGAGTGLLGMTTAKFLQQAQIPADVVLTDYHMQVLSNLRHNVEENFPTTSELADPVLISVEPLDWFELHGQVRSGTLQPDQPTYDLLLLADVIYAPEHAHWIRSSIQALLRKPGADDAPECAPRAHIIMAVRGTGKFEGLFRTVEEAFRPCSSGPQLTIIKQRRLDKRFNVGRNDEQEYLWFEIRWSL